MAIKSLSGKIPFLWIAAYLVVGTLVATIQPTSGASLWYPPIAIGLLFFLVCGLRFWPLILIADFIIAYNQYQEGFWVAAVVAGLTVCELSIAYGLLKWSNFDRKLERNEDLIRFGLIIALATAMGALIGCSILAAFNLATGNYWSMLWQWWLGDLTTSLCLLIPMLVLYPDSPGRFWAQIFPAQSHRQGRILLLLCTMVLVLWFVLQMEVWSSAHAVSLRPVIFIPVLWAAILFDRRLTAFLVIVTNILTVLALWVLVPAIYPLAGTGHMGVLDVQIFMIVLTFGGIGLSIALDSERRLRKNENLFQVAIEEAPFPSMIHAENGEVLLINHAWKEITGYSHEDIPTLSQWTQKAYGLDWKPVLTELEKLYDLRRRQDEGEFQIRCADGSRRIWKFSSMSLGRLPDGRKMAISMAVDLTEQKQLDKKRRELEAKLRQKHKMEAVGYLAGGMAHNFNNNLAIILGNLELIQLGLGQQGEIGPLLKNAQLGVKRSRELIENILSYSRADDAHRHPVKPAAVVEETFRLLKSTIPSTVHLNVSIPEQCQATLILGNESRLQEVLINLSNNAVYAMNEQGQLDINLEILTLQQDDLPAGYEGKVGDYIKLCMRDNGCGIDPEVVEKIFDPFFSTKELHEGTGMGLATVQGIIAQHNGFIDVASSPGQGTAFNLYFPVLAEEEESSREETPLTFGRGHERILLVDDDQMIVDTTERMLIHAGYQVTPVTDSQKALALFESDPGKYDLVITDQTMPNLSGLELLKGLLQRRPELPTILCTGFSSKIDKEQVCRQGIRALVMKPVDYENLLKVIRQVIEQKKFVIYPSGGNSQWNDSTAEK